MSDVAKTERLFRDLDLLEPILRALDETGYEKPTPIQSRAIPPLLEGKDLVGIAQTGTGKTAAFTLPMLDFLAGDPQPPSKRCVSALVLTPTRELAAQIGDSVKTYGQHLKLRSTVIFGGVGQEPQVRAVRNGVDILIATPGRLLDLCDQGHVDLSEVEVFVLDEADRMLDMGFLPAVRRVLQMLSEERQSVLFSATMPKDIVELSKSILKDPVRVEVTPPSTTVEKIDQKLLLVEKADKRALLSHLLNDDAIERVLVFTRTKHGADRVVKHLRRDGHTAEAIHGNKSQGARERALSGFREGRITTLVATDIAARGIDVDGITHVVNFDLPNVPETYVHRIGRTARAGREGVALSFCDVEERPLLLDIEKSIRLQIPRFGEHPFQSSEPLVRPSEKRPDLQPGGRRGGRSKSSNSSRSGRSGGRGRRGSQGRRGR